MGVIFERFLGNTIQGKDIINSSEESNYGGMTGVWLTPIHYIFRDR